jgi:hypothetical protein
LNSNNRSILVILGIILLTASLNGQVNNPPFDVNKVIGRVSSQRDIFNSREDEFLIDTNLVFDPAPEAQMSPSIAFDGTNYLVVWEDCRAGIGAYHIYATRVNENGDVLDPSGIFIQGDYGNSIPSVAFNGSNYFVVWRQQVEYYLNYFSWIHGALISPSGTVLSYTYHIAEFDAIAKAPSVASDGSNFLVVWYQAGDIYGARITPTGSLIERIVISNATEGQSFPEVDFDGSNYLVVWQDERNGNDIYDIYGTRVASSGVVLDTSGLAISTSTGNQMYPSVTFDDTNNLVVWQDHRSGDWDIYGTRVSFSGNIIDTAGLAISTAVSHQYSPKVAFDGVNYFVAWYDERNGSISSYDIYGTRVMQSGVVIDTGGIAISTASSQQKVPGIVVSDTNYLVVWEDWRDAGVSHYNIYGARVNASGEVMDSLGFVVSTVGNEQKVPLSTFNGSNYFIVWQEYHSTYWDIYGTRVDPYGVTLDTPSIAISTLARDQSMPSVTFGEDKHLVVWQNDNGYHNPKIYGARVDLFGVVLDTSVIVVSDVPGENPAAAFDGTNYFVVWMDRRSVWNEPDIYGTRVNQSGNVLDSLGIPISTETNKQLDPSIVFNGTNYFVVWVDKRSGSYRIYGSRVSPSGTVIDTAGIQIPAIPTASSWRPSIAYDGLKHFVVWQVFSNNSNWDIYGARVDQAGIVVDTAGFIISANAYQQEYPYVVFDGINYVVVWEETHSDSKNICGARVDTSGTVIDSFVISQQPGDQISPAIAHGSGDQLLITYSGWTDSINGKPANMMRIWGILSNDIGVEEDRELDGNVARPYLEIYPNPFSQITDIRLKITDINHKPNLTIYDVTGRLVKDFSKPLSDISNQLSDFAWDGADNAGNKLPRGVYFVKFTADNYSATKKVIFIK